MHADPAAIAHRRQLEEKTLLDEQERLRNRSDRWLAAVVAVLGVLVALMLVVAP